jgi:hypothetical protein
MSSPTVWEFVRFSPASGDYQRTKERWAATHVVMPVDEFDALPVKLSDLAPKYAEAGPLLELDGLLGKWHAAVWEAAEKGVEDYDMAGVPEAKVVQKHIRRMLMAPSPLTTTLRQRIGKLRAALVAADTAEAHDALETDDAANCALGVKVLQEFPRSSETNPNQPSAHQAGEGEVVPQERQVSNLRQSEDSTTSAACVLASAPGDSNDGVKEISHG